MFKNSVDFSISLLFLAMIGKKTRENFEAKESNQHLYKNEGFKINNSKTPDIIHFPENINSIPCKLSDKTDEERNKEIQMQAQDAKQQFFAKVMRGCRFISKICDQMCKRPIEQNIIIRHGTADCHEKWNSRDCSHRIG